MTLEVIKPGTQVLILCPSDTSIRGTVSGVSIYNNNRIIYLVCWWNGRERKECWVEANEVVKCANEKSNLKIGFQQ